MIYLTDGLSFQDGTQVYIVIIWQPGLAIFIWIYFFQRAMEDIGLKTEEICDIFKIVASVLKLGNLQFVPTTNMDGTEGCSIANEYGQF